MAALIGTDVPGQRHCGRIVSQAIEPFYRQNVPEMLEETCVALPLATRHTTALA
jgi:hypothetical protein